MRGSVWQTKVGIVLGALPLLLSSFIARFEGGARTAYIALLVALLVSGAILVTYGWRQDRRALLARQAKERTDADIAKPS